MSEEKNHIHFTATDIEKYHRGQLSAKDMHDLEKAALDDPFLADALEGYAIPGVDAAADIAALKQRLSQRTETGRIAIMHTRKRPAFSGWKAAAIIVVVAGAGLLLYQFGFTKRSSPIAQSTPGENRQLISKDSISHPGISKVATDDYTLNTESTKSKSPLPKENTAKVSVSSESLAASKRKADTAEVNLGLVNKSSVTFAQTQPVVNNRAMGNISEKKETKDVNPVVNANTKATSSDERQKFGEGLLAKKTPSTDLDFKADKLEQPNNGYYSKSIQSPLNNRTNNIGYLHNNIFRGKVMDANNNALPFANITNISDSIGTYADAKGNFNFVSPDSVLNVEVRSVGFNNMNAQLRNNVASNQVIMREDRSLNEVVISDKKPNAKARADNMKLEEPEPADGWDNYDTYLANNLNIPEEVKEKKTGGEVEVSFEVDKNGEPVRIKVEKSLCSKCDQEAIRLIKQGPKWKRKAKNGRTKVTVPFDSQ